jgi:3-methyladenine DNA glycosylase/8-oxoguanine DNA glycosylase
MILRPRGPFSLRQSVLGRGGGTLRARGAEVEMTLRPDGGAGVARVAQLSGGALRVTVVEGDERAVAAAVRRRLCLDVDTTPFRELFADDPLIGARLRTRAGVRPVARGTVAQALLAAVAGQLITWPEAAAIEARVAGAAAPRAGGLTLPPTRAELAALPPARLAARGLSPGRAATLARVVRALDTESLRDHPSAAVRARLARERGLGPWSAGVVALLGLGRMDVGLVGDLGLIRIAGRLAGRAAGPADTAALLAPYGEWAGLASLHLLAHPWATAPPTRAGPATRRAGRAGPRATPRTPAPPPRASPRPSPG